MQKAVLANAMEGHVLSLSLQMYGCRVVQKACSSDISFILVIDLVLIMIGNRIHST